MQRHEMGLFVAFFFFCYPQLMRPHKNFYEVERG